jgi:hypothetical protein
MEKSEKIVSWAEYCRENMQKRHTTRAAIHCDPVRIQKNARDKEQSCLFLCGPPWHMICLVCGDRYCLKCLPEEFAAPSDVHPLSMYKCVVCTGCYATAVRTSEGLQCYHPVTRKLLETVELLPFDKHSRSLDAYRPQPVVLFQPGASVISSRLRSHSVHTSDQTCESSPSDPFP